MPEALLTAPRAADAPVLPPDADALDLTVHGEPKRFYLPRNEYLRNVVVPILQGREYPLAPLPGYAPEVILDVGANVGAAALFFRAAYPGARVLCYEPSRDNLDYLRANAAQFPAVEVRPYGLYDADAEAPMYAGTSQSATNSLFGNAQTGAASEVVRLVGAAGEMRRLGFGRVSIVKLDTEGAEVPILRSLLGALAAVDLAYVEYHSEEDRREIDRLMSADYLLLHARAGEPHLGTCLYIHRALAERYPHLTGKRIARSPLGAARAETDPVTPAEEPVQQVELGFRAADAEHVVTLELDTRAFSQRLMRDHLRQGVFYEPELSYFLTNVLRPGDTFVDVGGHVGYFTLLAARAVGETGRVLTFEPERGNYERILAHVVRNGLHNVEAYNVALGDEEGTALLHVNADNDGGHALWSVGEHPQAVRTRAAPERREVPVATLDGLLLGRPELRPRIIKIDAEGSEHAIVRGSLMTIQHREVPFVVCEINEFALRQLGSSGAGLRALLAAFGYDCYRMVAEEPFLVPFPPGEEYRSPYVYNVLFTNQTVG